jgi:hypothetical protein
MVTMMLLLAVVAVSTEYTTTVNRHVYRANNYETALAIGDSCMEILFANWKSICSASPTSVQTTNAFSAIPTPSPGQFPSLNNGGSPSFVSRGTNYDPDTDEYDANYTISNYKVVAVTPEFAALSSANATPIPTLGRIGGPIAAPSPSTSLAYNYIASADVTLPSIGSSGGSGSGKVVAKVVRVFQKQQTSPWNFAIFYEDPLEIHPGPQLTVTGQVHTNSDLYTAHNTLIFANQVTYGSDWSIGFMPGETTHAGETPASPHFPSGLPPSRDQALDVFGLDPSVFNSTDSNPNNDSYRELIEPPNTSYSDPLANERYWDQAGVIIEVSDNPNPNVRGWDGVNGHDIVRLYTVNPLTGVTTQVTNGPLYTMFHAAGAITTNQTIQDNREGATERLATLDVSKIVTGTGATLSYTQTFGNPVVYMYDTSASSSTPRAMRVKGASSIPSAGLTVASNNPVYIQGDFNTGGTGSAVPSNNPNNLNPNGTYRDPANPPNPQVSNYNRAPCSILGDSVNILSNNWNDANSGQTLSHRIATPTTINAAIVSGIVPSNLYSDGGYSGGAENFPRFLESWSNVPLTYYGSMVEVFNSAQAIGEWHYGGNIYNAPAREWFFDNNFTTNPPPGTLMAYTYIKGRWTVQ